jgi:hypothetical protein
MVEDHYLVMGLQADPSLHNDNEDHVNVSFLRPLACPIYGNDDESDNSNNRKEK